MPNKGYFKKGIKLIGSGARFFNSTRKQIKRVVRGEEYLGPEGIALEHYIVDSLKKDGISVDSKNLGDDYWKN
jgi:hypothetical protein